METTRDGAQSIHRALAILRIVAGGQWRGLRLKDVAAESGLSVATAHRILRALCDEGVVERAPTPTRYRVGQEISMLSLARGEVSPLVALADPYLRELCAQGKESVFLTVRARLDSVCIDRKTSERSINLLSHGIGARRPLGHGVAGLVLLAYMPAAEASDILRRNAARLLRHDTDPASIHRQLATIRTRGYAFTEIGVTPGSKAISVPVLDSNRRAIAAISIGAVAARLSDARAATLATLMTAQAKRLAARIGRQTAENA
ncbi:MAG: IclR family transcriptional regulator [Lautropia sp.]